VLTRLRSRRGQPRYHFVAFAIVLGAAGALAAAGSGLEDTRGPGAAERAPGARPDARAGTTLRIAWATPPGSLDPALASDHTALNVVRALGDPLVELGQDLAPAPGLAGRWEVSRDGRRVTFHLRADGRWTNGAPVTAGDFSYSWRRVLDPALESPHAPLLFGIRGAKAYNRCVGADCRRLVREVGVEAPDDRTLVVTLAAPRPWFLAEVAHPAFLPVHRPTVERHGRRWTGPRRIVTSGPFTLAELGRDSFTLVRSGSWRESHRVALERVDGRVIPDGNARVLAFDGGQVQALDGTGLPGTELPALRERREYEAYPALASYLYAFNLSSITDVHQRRAMALAVDRSALAENVLQREVVPATAFIPSAPWLADEAEPSPWLPPGGDLERARGELERAGRVERELTLLHVDEPRERELAAAVAAAWQELGIETEIRSRPRDRYLEFAGPLGRDSVDVYQAVQRPRLGDPVAFVAAWACRATQNKTNFCLRDYDRLLEQARAERNEARRFALYAQAEALLSGGERGRMPAVPLFWDVFPNLEALSVSETFRVDPLGRIDLAAIEIR
jgi:oligopeptide transport system substrate-binding protein